jgi:Holliday junction resolvasome RuvABC endonuclease subunit
MINTYRVLSLDPGSVNSGWAVIEFSGKKKFKIIKCGMLKCLMKDLKLDDLRDTGKPYRKELSRIVRKGKVNFITAERYTARIRGVTIESVNHMSGLTNAVAQDYNIPLQVFMAVTWKSRFKKFLELEEFYKRVHVPDHICDAAFIGFFFAEKNCGFDATQLKFEAPKKRLAKQIYDTSYDRKPIKKKRKVNVTKKPVSKATSTKRKSVSNTRNTNTKSAALRKAKRKSDKW